MAIRVEPEDRDRLQLPAEPGPIERHVLEGFELVGQRFRGWCWAACIAMVLEYLKAPQQPRVWEIAGAGLNCDGCDQDEPNPDECLLGLLPERVPGMWECFGVAIEALPWIEDDVATAVRESPVQVVYNGVHLVLVVGTYLDDDGKGGFVVHDPLEDRNPLEWEWGALLGPNDENVQDSFRILGLAGVAG